jgi:hypothetical protein
MYSIYGKILDAVTKVPLYGATITVTGGDNSDFSQLNTTSNPDGTFNVVDTTNYPVCCKFYLLIEFPGYIPQKLLAEWLQSFSSSKDLGTIMLMPVNAPAAQPPVTNPDVVPDTTTIEETTADNGETAGGNMWPWIIGAGGLGLIWYLKKKKSKKIKGMKTNNFLWWALGAGALYLLTKKPAAPAEPAPAPEMQTAEPNPTPLPAATAPDGEPVYTQPDVTYTTDTPVYVAPADDTTMQQTDAVVAPTEGSRAYTITDESVVQPAQYL